MAGAEKLAAWLQTFGPGGLFLAAALDSFVPLAHVVDPMVILLSFRHKDPLLYAALAVLGSVVGTTVLFLLVRAGGEAYVRKRLDPARRARMAALLERWGLLAVVAGGTLPPPFPFKAVVLLAGLARMRLPLFVLGVLLARSFRYGLESTLAVFYGDRVLHFMRAQYPRVGLAVVLAMVALWLVARRLLRPRATAGTAGATAAAEADAAALAE